MGVIIVQKYRSNFAVYDGTALVCVAVYRKGAEEVKRRLDGINQ